VLSRRSGVEGSTFSGTALKAPKDAKKNFEKAQEAIKKNKLDKARPLLEKAVAEYPEYAMAWFELGKIHQAAKDLPGRAKTPYQQAIKADAKYIYPYLHLAAVFNAQQNWEGHRGDDRAGHQAGSVRLSGRIQLQRHEPIRMGNAAEAEASAKKVVEMGAVAGIPEAEYMLGVILANRGETKAAVEHADQLPEAGAQCARRRTGQEAVWRKWGGREVALLCGQAPSAAVKLTRRPRCRRTDRNPGRRAAVSYPLLDAPCRNDGDDGLAHGDAVLAQSAEVAGRLNGDLRPAQLHHREGPAASSWPVRIALSVAIPAVEPRSE